MSHTFPPEAASDLDPLFVTSPAIRSGTTLLQRLLCSSSNALVYGEECGKDLGLTLQLYASRAAFYTHSRRRFSTSLRRVLDGDVNDWLTDLMPDPEGYARALGRAYLSGLAYCRDYAAGVGRKINTWVEGAGPAQNRIGYIEPAALTDAEKRMADEAASAVESAASVA